jgi:hypothetical protein
MITTLKQSQLKTKVKWKEDGRDGRYKDKITDPENVTQRERSVLQRV